MENDAKLPMPRSIDEELVGITLAEFITRRSANAFVKAANQSGLLSEDEICFDHEIEYLIHTVRDLTTRKTEIRRLWTLVFQIIKDKGHGLGGLHSTYLFPLVSITGQAKFDQDELERFVNKLENEMDDYLEKGYNVPGEFVRGIVELITWSGYLLDFQKYLKVGVRKGLTARVWKLTRDHLVDIETLKALSPATFLELVEYLKFAYGHDGVEQQIKWRLYYRNMLLQQIIVAKNSGNYLDYERYLEDYYTILYHDRPHINWLFKNLLGYGERPWKLFALFIGVNLIFSLLFSILPFDFKFQGAEPHCLDRLVAFFYFNNTSMLTVGYGDIYPQGTWTKLTVVLLQLLGFVISGSAIALLLKRILRF